MNLAEMIFIGLLVGTFGTLIGAGGGFILVPLLLFLYPNDQADVITSISLAVVFFNATSGTIAYARQGRVDFRSGVIFSIASIPGAILGAIATTNISRNFFENIFGIFMMAGGSLVFVKSFKNSKKDKFSDATSLRPHYNLTLGIVISLVVGFVSSFLGIGGGIIHVPVLVHVLEFPVHIATATSHFVLAVMALVGTIVHIAQGTLLQSLGRIFSYGIPAVVGAQVGAALSTRIHEHWITRSLALALILVGARLLMF